MTTIEAPRIEDVPLFAPFTAGLAAKRLMLQRCATCATTQLGRIRCDACLGRAFYWVPSCERGRIHAFAIMHRAYHPVFAACIPYAIGIVELGEGPRVVAALQIDRARLRAGLPVRVGWSGHDRAAPLSFIEENA